METWERKTCQALSIVPTFESQTKNRRIDENQGNVYQGTNDKETSMLAASIRSTRQRSRTTLLTTCTGCRVSHTYRHQAYRNLIHTREANSETMAMPIAACRRVINQLPRQTTPTNIEKPHLNTNHRHPMCRGLR